MAKLVSNVRGTDRISVFWNDDTGLLQYRRQHLRTGYMVSVGDWLHLYALSDAQGFYKLPHYTHTKTKPKVCVQTRAEIPDLIRFVLASVRPPLNQLKWGVSGAPNELVDTLFAEGFTLTTDGHMRPRDQQQSSWINRNI